MFGVSYRLLRPASVIRDEVALDQWQRRVVEHRAGGLLVVGGPGTGKTTTLVEAVTARVAQGVAPDRILALTFGRRSAARLRERIEARVGVVGRATAEPLVRTFHGYAFGLLRAAAANRGEPPPRLLTGPEQDLIIRELLAGSTGDWPAELRPALRTRAFAAQLRDLLLRSAERGVGPAELAGLGDRRGRPDWVSSAAFMREYEQVLALRDATGRAGVGYDNAELVRAALTLLEQDPDLLAAERGRLSFVYVDELADTDPVQLDLLALVAGGGGHLVAFADPDSSTYAFRGADPGGVREFPDRFGAASLLLTRSYRATPELLEVAARVAVRLRGPSRHRALTAAAQVGPPPGPVPPGRVGPGPRPAGPTVTGPAPARAEVHTFRSATSEAAYVGHRLREAHLLDEVPWDRMAVIVRSTTLTLATLSRALQQAGVPVATHAEDLPLRFQPAVAALLLALRCAVEPERLDEETAVALLHSPLGGADPLAERRLRQGLRALAMAGGDLRPSGVLLVEALRDPVELVAVERRWAAPARDVARLLAAVRETAARPAATAEDVLWALWQASGLADRWATASARGGHRGAAADRDLDSIMVLFDAVARFVDRLPGARIEIFLDHVLGQELPADTIARTADRGPAVRILTAHAAKGLEWDVVIVPGVQEGVWPDLRLRGSVLGSEQLVDVLAGREMTAIGRTAALLDEERRLFYVAVTRARRRLVVSAVASGDGEEQPSRFLGELSRGGPGPTRPDASGPDGADPHGSGPDVTGPDVTGPDVAGPDVAGPDSSEPRGSGQDVSGQDVSGQDVSGQDVSGQDVSKGPDGPDGPDGGAPSATRLPRALTLPALVAELRSALIDPTTPAGRRSAAASALARLAAAGVRGADPGDWWGLPALSDERPVSGPDEPVTVTPSTVESVQRCSLRWLLERHGGASRPSPEQGVGNLVHAAAMLATDARVDRATLIEYVAGRFDEIELSARWLAGRERERAEHMIDKLIGWLAANPRRLVAIERDFLVHLDDVVRIKGRVDRLEVDDQGRLVVIDLKTGKSTSVTEADLATQPQLGAYQAAVEVGAFADVGDEPGGAALVQLGSHAGAKEQDQPALSDSADPTWATTMVRRTAATMAAATFQAVVNSKCRACPVRTSCPVSGKGRQVTGDQP
jgi:superfamily I DNA/RNA helicase/RecB family exonuclease